MARISRRFERQSSVPASGDRRRGGFERGRIPEQAKKPASSVGHTATDGYRYLGIPHMLTGSSVIPVHIHSQPPAQTHAPMDGCKVDRLPATSGKRLRGAARPTRFTGIPISKNGQHTNSYHAQSLRPAGCGGCLRRPILSLTNYSTGRRSSLSGFGMLSY